MDRIGVFYPIPYANWLDEATKVCQEEMVYWGHSYGAGEAMRRAHAYMLKTVPNEHGGIGFIYVQNGWQQAMRAKSLRWEQCE